MEPLDPEHAATRAERLRHVAELRAWGTLATVIQASGVRLQAGDQAVLPQAGAPSDPCRAAVGTRVRCSGLLASAPQSRDTGQ